jgi:hypothetical protein
MSPALSAVRVQFLPPNPYRGPYGCIDRFTGDCVLGNFADFRTRMPADSYNRPDNLMLFYQGLLVAALRCGKQLYQKQQLDGVRSTVNTLCQFVGDPPLLPGPSFGDWSMRELFEVVANPGAALEYPPENLGNAKEPSGLRELVSQLQKSWGFSNVRLADTPPSQSLRYLLSSQ